MKLRLLFTNLILLTLIFSSCTEKDYLITIKTSYGDMKAVLFDETPQHKETFLELAQSGKYDSSIFHRVIRDFMIQGGDINRKPTNEEPVNILIPAEFREDLIHTKGMIAGARTGDNVNPEKKSGTQFYIVQGRKYNREEFDQQEEQNYYTKLVTKLNEIFQKGEHKDLLDKLIEYQQNNDINAVKQTVYSSLPIIEAEYGKITRKKYTDDQYKAYETLGGTPFLDMDYTVFGKVIDGLDVIDKIADQPTDGADKPLEDIFVTIEVEKMPKSKITKQFGYKYPSKDASE